MFFLRAEVLVLTLLKAMVQLDPHTAREPWAANERVQKDTSMLHAKSKHDREHVVIWTFAHPSRKATRLLPEETVDDLVIQGQIQDAARKKKGQQHPCLGKHTINSHPLLGKRRILD